MNVPPSEALLAEGRQHNETWAHYPDDAPKRSLYAGDTRAALVPFLAHKHFGPTYKWLLYMDDDTVFVPSSVRRLVMRLNSSVPYFVTDHLWWSDEKGSRHPNERAPRCLPCDFDPRTHAPLRGLLGPNGEAPKRRADYYRAPVACPCTPQALCEATPDVFDDHCDMPRYPENTYSMHGGAGAVVSVALLEAVSLPFMERCARSLHSTGGDAFISLCLWRAGYASTDPGTSLYEGGTRHFDPGSEDRLGAMRNLAAYVDGHWEGLPPARRWVTSCDARCEQELETQVSLHVRSRNFPSLEDAASFIRAYVGLQEAYESLREGRARQGVPELFGGQ